MQSEKRVIEINAEQFKLHLISFLYAAALVDDNEEIKDIDFGNLNGQTIPLEVIYQNKARILKF